MAKIKYLICLTMCFLLGQSINNIDKCLAEGHNMTQEEIFKCLRAGDMMNKDFFKNISSKIMIDDHAEDTNPDYANTPLRIAEDKQCPHSIAFENVKNSNSCMNLVKSNCPNKFFFAYAISTQKCSCIENETWYNEECFTFPGYAVFSIAKRLDFNSEDIANDKQFAAKFDDIAAAQEERDYQIFFRYLGMPKEEAQKVDANTESVMPNFIKKLYEIFVSEENKEIVRQTNGMIVPKHYALKLGNSIWEIRGDGTKIGENNIIMYWPNFEKHPMKNKFDESDWKGKTILSNHRIAQFVQGWLTKYPIYGILGTFDFRDLKTYTEGKIANCQDFTMDLTKFCKNNASTPAQKKKNVYQPVTQISTIIEKFILAAATKISKYF